MTDRPQDLFDLSGCRACVTGASSGIGQALASALARAGAWVVGIARREEALEDWKKASVTAGLDVEACAADVGTPKAAEETGRDLAERFGPIDILINAAGVNPRKPAEDITLEEWQATLDLNLSTPFFLARGLVPGMKQKGWGRIVNIASLQSVRAFPAGIAYGASKGGVAQLTRAMAEAWSGEGITCNAIAPGFFPTPLTSKVFENEQAVAKLAGQTCIGRNGELSDLTGPLLFLASPASNYVTGQVLFVDGGFTAK